MGVPIQSGSKDQPDHQARLYVADLPSEVTETELLEKFSSAGRVTSIKVVQGTNTRKGLSHAYVDFEERAEAERAIDTMNSDVLKGQQMQQMQQADFTRSMAIMQQMQQMSMPQMFSVPPPPPGWHLLSPHQMAAVGLPYLPHHGVPFMSVPPPGMPQMMQPMMMVSPVMAPVSMGEQMPCQFPGQEPLTASVLAAAPPKEQKQMLGERLYPQIKKLIPDHHSLACKITGMLLVLDDAEVLHMLEDDNDLKSKFQDAVTVLLQAYQGA